MGIWKKETKSLGLSLTIAICMIGIDQLIKWCIYTYNKDAINNCNGSNHIFHYHPVFNESGSFLNLKLNMEYNKFLFLGIALVGVLLGLYLLNYSLRMKQLYCCNYIIMLPSNFFLAACFGRLLERIFWQYTLDFIAIKNIGVLDFIDIYLVFGCVGLIFVACYLQYMENK